jgi:hypothetical protein
MLNFFELFNILKKKKKPKETVKSENVLPTKISEKLQNTLTRHQILILILGL